MFIESGTVKCWPIWSPAGSIGMKGARWQGKVENNILCFSEEKFCTVHARCKLSEVGSCNFRWNEIYGAEHFSSLDQNVRVLSLPVYGARIGGDLYRLLEVMDWISGWNRIESSYVFNFTGEKRNENYIYGIWNFKNLQFDGIVSKCSLVPSSGIIRQLMIIGES